MRRFVPRWFVLICILLGVHDVNASDPPSLAMHPRLAAYVAERLNEFPQISAERRAALEPLVAYLRACRAEERPIAMTFVCTHNSRRSQMGQVWAAVAAAYFGVDGVTAYSGGTEVTAFNPRAVAALQRAGLVIEKEDDAAANSNPRYRVSFAPSGDTLLCFSKRYADEFNPQSDFCAVMTCNEADQACPQVAGARGRYALPYEDPKVADGTSDEANRYDERCAQIAREMLFVFSQVP